jgi:CheY-like chemotaxis protein
MPRSRRPITILMADDDADDREFARDALAESRLANVLHCVEDGEELLEYLGRRGRHASPADPELRRIPIVVLTTSKAEEDIYRSYDLGANSFITKPVTFPGLVEVMKNLGRYWFEIVDLPPPNDGDQAGPMGGSDG